MTRHRCVLLFLLLLAGAAQLSAQGIDVDQKRKTLTVTVRETVSVDADVAVLQIGYVNQGSTHQQVYGENVKIADKILKALTDAGISTDAIETEALEVSGPGRYDYEQRPKGQEFHAYQQWAVRVKASDAQHVVDIAVAAGANQIGEVAWTAGDVGALEAKANEAALAKARTLAHQMANSLGVKLGELVSVMNFTPSEYEFLRRMAGGGGVDASMARMATPGTEMKLRLFPQKVRHEATVYVVYAFEQ